MNFTQIEPGDVCYVDSKKSIFDGEFVQVEKIFLNKGVALVQAKLYSNDFSIGFKPTQLKLYSKGE